MTAHEAWIAAVRPLGGDAAAAGPACDDLAARYDEPHRRYHGRAHLEAVVRDAGWLADELGLSETDRAVAVLAACVHDVIYEARPGADEQASAEWARRRLEASGVPSDPVDRVVGLVLATITHSADIDDAAATALLDADLAVLGAPAGEYARYVDDVRAEYAAVPEQAWREGRSRLLTGLLAREPLYRSEPARLRWEQHARRNLTVELARLQA
jgi:predicted metal-dependent HD superfamily phosphohydrolase